MSPFHLYSMCLNKHSVGGEGPYYFFKHCEISRSPVDSSNLLHPSNFICRPALVWQEAVRWPVPCVQTLTPDEVTPNTRCKLYLVNTPLSSSALQLLQFFRVAAEAADWAAWPCRLHGHQAAAAALLQCLVSSLDIYDTEWSRCILNTGVTLQKWEALCACLNNEVRVIMFSDYFGFHTCVLWKFYYYTSDLMCDVT